MEYCNRKLRRTRPAVRISVTAAVAATPSLRTVPSRSPQVQTATGRRHPDRFRRYYRIGAGSQMPVNRAPSVCGWLLQGTRLPPSLMPADCRGIQAVPGWRRDKGPRPMDHGPSVSCAPK